MVDTSAILSSLEKRACTAMMKTDKPSDLEMQILGVLWRDGASTVRHVLGAIPDGKPRAYTSVLSMMQVMEKKGLLSRSREGLADHWRPALAKSRVLGPFLRRLVANVFGGEPKVAMQQLLQETDLDDAALAEVRQMLDDYGQRRRSDAADGVKPEGKRA